MDVQVLVVALVVLGCALYATWSLMPRAARRALAVAAARRAWPAPIARFWQRHAAAGNACGCDGCDAGSTPKKPDGGPASAAVRPITFHRRPPR